MKSAIVSSCTMTFFYFFEEIFYYSYEFHELWILIHLKRFHFFKHLWSIPKDNIFTLCLKEIFLAFFGKKTQF